MRGHTISRWDSKWEATGPIVAEFGIVPNEKEILYF